MHQIYTSNSSTIQLATVVRNNNPSNLEPRGVSQFLVMSHLTSYDTITSRPVRLCLRSEMIINCSQLTTTIDIKLKDSFLFYVVAVDQVNILVFLQQSGVVLQILLRRKAKLFIELMIAVQNLNTVCHLVKRTRPEGPCGNKSISMTAISIHVVDCTCPPGFMKAKIDTKCECVCDKRYETFTNTGRNDIFKCRLKYE